MLWDTPALHSAQHSIRSPTLTIIASVSPSSVSCSVQFLSPAHRPRRMVIFPLGSTMAVGFHTGPCYVFPCAETFPHGSCFSSCWCCEVKRTGLLGFPRCWRPAQCFLMRFLLPPPGLDCLLLCTPDSCGSSTGAAGLDKSGLQTKFVKAPAFLLDFLCSSFVLIDRSMSRSCS
jgi:hypothetical protein